MKIKHLKVEGYKSYSPLCPFDLPLGNVTVLLGANGAGKSNLLDLLKGLKNNLTASWGRMSFYGSVVKTKAFRATFTTEDGDVSSCSVYWDEDGGIREERQGRLPCVNVYQFNNTSPTSAMKEVVSVFDCAELHEDGSNLAAVLKRLRDDFPQYYNRIVFQIRRVMPQFGGFELDDPRDEGNAILCWKDRGFPMVKFNPNQLSDGSLRFIALITLLLLPQEMLPEIVLLDEPEIGLHPKALVLLHGIIKQASKKCQIVLTTQSGTFVNLFDPEEIVVVERDVIKGYSVAKRLNTPQLKSWLEEFSIAEIWEKNLFGGNP